MQTSETFFQKVFFQDTTYHREDSEASNSIKERIKTKMIQSTHIYLTDTRDIDQVLPLRFFVVPSNKKDWSESLVKKMESHITKEWNMDDFLKPIILFDFTHWMEEIYLVMIRREKRKHSL